MNPATDHLRDNTFLEMPLPWDQIKQIGFETTGQRDNYQWKQTKMGKLTSSNFGQAIAAIHNPHPSNIERLREVIYFPKDLSRIPAIQWGTDHENDGIDAYVGLSGYIVKPTGVWLYDNGCMGASPDGLVYPSKDATTPCGIVEIKCPYSLRNTEIKATFMWSQLPYLTERAQLKRNHDYYHQVQGAMYAVRVPWCDFCVWTPKNKLLIIRVCKDASWGDIYLEKLEQFYHQHLMRAEDKPLDELAAIEESFGEFDDAMEEMPTGMQPTPHRDLNCILYPVGESNKELRTIFASAFELHLARLIHENLVYSRSGSKWSLAVYNYWNLAVCSVCETCLRSLFKSLWYANARKSAQLESQDIITRILNEDEFYWSTMLYDPEFAETVRNYLMGYQPTNDASMPSCTCRYTHHPGTSFRYCVYF